jgi:type VI secretion system FHA domain protein
MIVIKAVSFNGQPVTTALRATFGEDGGIIGRANGNALVLPDPDRFVSRTHARIACRAGTYVISDLGSSSPVYVNGQPLGNGREANLALGDELRIGAYALQVEAPPAMLNRQAEIPDNFDPFADMQAPPPDPLRDNYPSKPQDNLNIVSEPAANMDINHIFGLGSSSHADSLLDGPLFGGSGDHRPGYQSADPLQLLGGSARPSMGANSQRDNTPSMRAALVPPLTSPGNEQKLGEGNRSGLPTDALNRAVYWSAGSDSEAGDIKTILAQSPGKALGRPARPAANAFKAISPALDLPQPPAPVAASADNELLRAFLSGAGVPDLDMQTPLTAQTMALLGQLLREALQGTLDLLMARALTKREMHAEMTMIATRENNPIKFCWRLEGKASCPRCRR